MKRIQLRDNASASFIRASTVFDIVKFLLLLTVIIWMTAAGTERLGYHWQWYRIPRYLFTLDAGHFTSGPLLHGLLVTFKITGVSMIAAFSVGLVVALFRLSQSFTALAVARGYLELVRNTPLLIQLFFIYFVIAPVTGMSAFASAVLALSLFEGAYISEIFRSGILAVQKGQWEASYSLGLTTFQTYRLVVLPQAFRIVLPPLTSQAISLIKDSALVSTIAIYDLTMMGQAIIAETFLTFEIWFTVAAIYLVITVLLSFLVRALETRMKLDT